MDELYDYQIEFLRKIIEGKPIRFICRRWSGKEEGYIFSDEFRQLQKITVEIEQ